MSQIGEIKKLSDTRFLNFYEFEAVHRDGTSAPYFVASRAKKIEQLKAVSHENKPDGVILFGVYGEKKDRVVLVRQYRYPLGVTSTNSPPVLWKAAKTWWPPVSGKCTRKPGLPLPRWTQAPVPGRFSPPSA